MNLKNQIEINIVNKAPIEEGGEKNSPYELFSELEKFILGVWT
ncbi:hypothetical protein N9L43_00880 [bacterium]|nr:hypothetical protein [bacterium]